MKRVLLIASSTLFGRGVENLLQQEEGLDFLGCEVDVNQAMERVKTLKPDVVILERSQAVAELGNVLERILHMFDHLKVIELDPKDDNICIYSGQQQVVKQVQDLLKAIE
jgi:chemotaxis response regulator CheB